MNDLRSRSRALSAVPDEGAAPTSTPPRVRPETEDRGGRRMSRRQSIAERARRLEAAEAEAGADGEHMFQSSRPRREPAVAAGDQAGQPAAGADAPGGGSIPDQTLKRRDDDANGPSSRPTKRRDVTDEDQEEEDRFPWHFQFDDDEPEELQASSPLLSRAFRATTG